MTIYEKARIQLRNSMDSEIDKLDTRRSTIGEAEYWNQFKLIHSKYSDKVAEVDEAERSRRSIQQAKETGVAHDRPEQRYVDVMGQLKAQKLTELIAKLAECSSTDRIDNLSTADPFYYDKMDPIGTFERWWNEEMESFPSYDSMQDFLRRVTINEQGFLVFKEAGYEPHSAASSETGSEQVESRDSVQSMDFKQYQNILKEASFKTARQRAQERKEKEAQKIKLRSPLLATPDYIKSKQQRKRRMSVNEGIISRLSDIVYSYDLDVGLQDLLIEHIEYVCVPAGMCRDDQYRPMLEQFLRYVEDNNKRKHIVREAISRGWRILSDGTI